MEFDPAVCTWDRPGQDTVYRGRLRILHVTEGWCRSATPEEILWIAAYEQRQKIISLLENTLFSQELHRHGNQ